MSDSNDTSRAWHHEPLVWMIIALPSAAVIAGFFTLYLAVRSDDGLVVDDYYKQGLEINRVLEREETATEAGLNMSVQFDEEHDAILVALSAREGFEFPPLLEGVLAHATRAGLDFPLDLKRVGDAMYRAENIAPPPGRWYLNVGTPEWRLTIKITTR